LIFTNPSQSRESTLILEWGKHSLSFSVFHELDNRVLATQVIELHLDLFDFTAQDFEKLIKENEIFAFSFQKVVCLLDINFLSLVPNQFFEESKIESYLKFNMNLPSGKLTFKSESVLSTDYQALFILPRNLVDAMERNFMNISYKLSNIVLLNYFAKLTQLDRFFEIHFNDDFLSIFYYEGNKLLFYNAFEYISAEDIIYHTLNVMNDLGLDNERELVYYSGQIMEETDNMKLLQEYIKYLKPLERSNKINYSAVLENMPSHYFIQHYANCL
jgi:hypothetical protein